MQSVDRAFGIIVDDSLGDDERTALVSGADAVHAKTTWETSDRSKKGLECLGEMMRDVVLVDLSRLSAGSVSQWLSTDLHHGPPRAFFVIELGFATDGNDLGIVGCTGDEPIE